MASTLRLKSRGPSARGLRRRDWNARSSPLGAAHFDERHPGLDRAGAAPARIAGRIERGGCAGAADGRRHRPRQRRLHPQGTDTRRQHGRPAGGNRARHPGRARHLDAFDHQGHPRLAGAGGHLRLPGGRARGERRYLHPVREPHRRHGAGHQPRRGHPRGDRHRRCAAQTHAAARRRVGTGRGCGLGAGWVGLHVGRITPPRARPIAARQRKPQPGNHTGDQGRRSERAAVRVRSTRH